MHHKIWQGRNSDKFGNVKLICVYFYLPTATISLLWVPPLVALALITSEIDFKRTAIE